jgi:hypothetical protein
MTLSRCLVIIFLLLSPFLCAAEDIPHLPGTAPLLWQGDLADKMMEGLHTYIEGKIAQSIEKRPQHWERDCSSPVSYNKSIEANRQRFRKIIGVVDPRLPVRMERFGDEDAPALVAEKNNYRIYQVRWSVLDGVWGEGLLLEPKGKPVADVIALPDADQTPEQLAGLTPGVANEAQFARRLVENGFRVVAPVLIDRSDRWSGNALAAISHNRSRFAFGDAGKTV